MVDVTNGRFDGSSKAAERAVDVSAGSREHRRHWHRRRAQQFGVDEVAVGGLDGGQLFRRNERG
jgi:hypothetical protein